MAHLGDDVAAYVDGQLTPEATAEATRHLERCDRCATAVLQQRTLKARMAGGVLPEPPVGLVESLSVLAAHAPLSTPPWWRRALVSGVPGVAVVLMGASLVVVGAAWVVGAPESRWGDDVVPTFEAYVAGFGAAASAPAATRASVVTSISEDRMADLDASGWPCHARLAGFARVDGRLVPDGDLVVLDYEDDADALRLVEQSGALDEAGLAGFTEQQVAGRTVWVREGSPRVVTWDADGVVFTVVSDADPERVAAVVADLPAPLDPPSPSERVGDGLAEMAGWLSAA